MDNSQKIFQIMSGEEVLAHNNDDGEDGDEEEDSGIHFSDVAAVNDGESEESEELDGLEITGTNLKGLIEQELNA
jgi:hypothetical protein